MVQDPSALLRLFAAGALGWLMQATLFGPKKVPTWFAWSALGLGTLLIYWWATPTAVSEFQSNWRFAVVGVVSFFLTAKGTGSAAAAAKIAPKTDSL